MSPTEQALSRSHTLCRPNPRENPGLVGAVLIVVGRGRSGSTGAALQVIGWGMQVLLILGVIVVASGRGFAVPGLPRPGSGDRVRPLPLLGFLTVSGLLLWQAARGLS